MADDSKAVKSMRGGDRHQRKETEVACLHKERERVRDEQGEAGSCDKGAASAVQCLRFRRAQPLTSIFRGAKAGVEAATSAEVTASSASRAASRTRRYISSPRNGSGGPENCSKRRTFQPPPQPTNRNITSSRDEGNEEGLRGAAYVMAGKLVRHVRLGMGFIGTTGLPRHWRITCRQASMSFRSLMSSLRKFGLPFRATCLITTKLFHLTFEFLFFTRASRKAATWLVNSRKGPSRTSQKFGRRPCGCATMEMDHACAHDRSTCTWRSQVASSAATWRRRQTNSRGGGVAQT